MPVSQVTHQGTACGPPQRLGHAALFDQGRGKGQMTCARRPSPRISAGELPGRTDRPWLSPSNTAEHRREDARRPSLGGSRWPSEDVSRQLDLPKKDGTVHNTVLSHWTNSKKLFLINGLGAVFCFLRPLHIELRQVLDFQKTRPTGTGWLSCCLIDICSQADRAQRRLIQGFPSRQSR